MIRDLTVLNNGDRSAHGSVIFEELGNIVPFLCSLEIQRVARYVFTDMLYCYFFFNQIGA